MYWYRSKLHKVKSLIPYSFHLYKRCRNYNHHHNYLGGFYIVRVYVNVRTYYSSYKYWYLPYSYLCRNYTFTLYVSPDRHRRTAFINNYPKHLTGICIAELIVSWWVRNCSLFKKSEVRCRFDRIPYLVTTLSQTDLVFSNLHF
jgi:hypothetical protein